MTKPSILVIDDDPLNVKLISKILIHEGMVVQSADCGQIALAMLKHQTFDLVILDIMLPDISGYELADAIRKKDLTLPLIFLSGKCEEADIIHGLSHGVDSYITKPFSPNLLIAQVRLRLQRFKDFNRTDSKAMTDGLDKWFLDAGPFRIDLQKNQLYKRGKEIKLTAKELAIMRLLMENPDLAISKADIYSSVWNSTKSDTHSVQVHMLSLRSKVEDNPHIPKHLHAVRGVGYKFVP